MKTGSSFMGTIEMPTGKRALTLRKPPVFAGIRRVAQRVIAWAYAMCQTVAERRALARMDERMFADIGISQSEAAFEMNRKPWDTAPLPSNRCL
jgi:uncharacterized protein YjiS (DUF1127 family)